MSGNRKHTGYKKGLLGDIKKQWEEEIGDKTTPIHIQFVIEKICEKIDELNKKGE